LALAAVAAGFFSMEARLGAREPDGRIADPAARAPLERLVRCTVALRRDVALDDVPDVATLDADDAGVDPRALRALGRLPARVPPEVP
ncbi:MAG: hypothetical protein P1P87_16860, partial [Trueperaceae bacterium]|nr:hypothetical protein [Trueperaceae bacterium]